MGMQTFRLHKLVSTPTKFTYKAKKPYVNNGQDLQFICDAPHLIKKCMGKEQLLEWVRDCYALELFYCGQRKGNMLVKLHYDNHSRQALEIALLTQPKYKHIFLTSFSKMRVDLAAQVNVLKSYRTHIKFHSA